MFNSEEELNRFYAEEKWRRLAMKEFRKQRSKEVGKARIFRKFKRRQVNKSTDI